MLTGLFLSAAGQNFKEQFNDLYNKKDTVGEKKLLAQWETKKQNDPELYVAYFNYYVQKSMTEMIGLEHEQKGEHSLQLTDSTGKVAGYMNDMVVYADKDLQKGFDYIDKGIKMFPNRLDMRFGKVYMLGKKENYMEFTDEIIKTIDYSNTNKNTWLWADDKPQKDPKEFMLGSIQDYVLQLYNTNDDKLLDNMKRISETVLKYYPDHVESLSDLSIVYMINKDYDKALEQLLKAEKIAPSDYIVLMNIAEAYKRKGDNENAIIYYEKVVKVDDADIKADAKKKIDELKKK
ncbi:MAG: tetratricopeptide repeat protein [Candidatus Kapabacteria bacterium]|nr:tetratricopeptide repeat protein [Candidatus Kapabacteria bacterium]